MDNHSYSELQFGQLLSMLNHLSRGDVAFASPYMAIVKTPFSNLINTYNPKSFEPNDYKRSNIINNNIYFATKKESPWNSLVSIPEALKQN